MKLFTPHFVLVLLLFYFCTLSRAQKAFTVKLEIDTTGLDIDNLEGTFGLHAEYSKYAYSSNTPRRDSFIRQTPITPIQYVKVPAATLYLHNYSIQYAPADSNLKSRKIRLEYFYSEKDTTTYSLNSYFFYQAPTSFLDNMKEKDTLILSSTYSGESHEMMPIPSYALAIVKDGEQYQALYFEQTRYFHQLIDIRPRHPSRIHPFPKPTASLILDKKHLSIIQDYEKKLPTVIRFDNYAPHEFLPNQSCIQNTEKLYLFKAKGHIGLELWQLLRIQTFLSSYKNGIFNSIKMKK